MELQCHILRYDEAAMKIMQCRCMTQPQTCLNVALICFFLSDDTHMDTRVMHIYDDTTTLYESYIDINFHTGNPMGWCRFHLNVVQATG